MAISGLTEFLPADSSLLPSSPVDSVMAATSPFNGNRTLQKAMEVRRSAGPVDSMNMFRLGMDDAQGRMDTLQAQLGPAGDAMNQGQEQLMARLKQNYSPERESQLNWQALGNMGAAMMKPAEYGGHNQWSAGQAA